MLDSFYTTAVMEYTTNCSEFTKSIYDPSMQSEIIEGVMAKK